jgi:hypothetical protein
MSTSDAAGPVRVGARATAWVAALAGALFATTALDFGARVTDLSALRVLDGEIPYRDFWTVYAPGSYTLVAAGFALFGREMIVSNVLGLLAAAGAVAAYHRAAARAAGGAASVPALLMAVAFYHSGYHRGLSSYPAAAALIWLAVVFLARFAESGERRALAACGGLLGLGVLCKHDVAGYAGCASAAALLARPATASFRARLADVALLCGAALAVLAPAAALLWTLGAGPDMLHDLVVFPLTDFRWVREEYFPIVPRLSGPPAALVREMTRWSICTGSLLAAAAGTPGLWRRRRHLGPSEAAVVLFALAALPLFWLAAHRQINTHAVTLPALGALVAAAGLRGGARRGEDAPRARAPRGIRAAWLAPPGAALWAALLAAEPARRALADARSGAEPIALPRLAAIRAPRGDAAWMRSLAAAIRDAAPADAPLLVIGRRNDVLIYADASPYWLTARPIATRHHELHPGVTDTEPVQREMIRDLERGPRPVLVREHRFADAHLDRVRERFQKHVAVGASRLDAWVTERYEPGPRFGRYELMVPRAPSR